MFWTAVILLFISAATCSSTSRNYIPLSAPLPNGTMVLQVNSLLAAEARLKYEPSMKCPPKLSSSDLCLGTRGCCSTNDIQGWAIELLCGNSGGDDLEWVGMVQHNLNTRVAVCHFDGHSADNVQLLLTPNASDILNSLNRQDEKLRQQQAIYLALQMIGGHIGLPILLLFSIFPKKAPRNLIFLNFCYTWTFSSIIFCIGLYRLGPASIAYLPLPFIHSDEECLAQGALVSGAQVMTDTAMCALIIQLWLDIRAAIHGPRTPGQIRWTIAALLVAPYVSLLAFLLPTLGPANFSSGGPLASQGSFYCAILEKNAFLLSQYTVMLSILMVTLIFDVCIIHILYRHWRFFRRTGENGHQVSLSMVLRVIIFCVYRVVVAVAYMATVLRVLGIGALSGLNGVWVDMLQGGTPCVAFLIFGMSKEFLDASMFWRRFNSILNTLMFRRRRTPGSQRAYDAHGEVFDAESLVSGDSVLDIGKETKGSDEGLVL
ncbi:hypothetical protein JB92DRAFT_3150376 [Gautieria morchelliformis]|nr:hypothetical protein JB92DRAFT_3150376 [Gautieria morchelliformis]